jgi:TIR domain
MTTIFISYRRDDSRWQARMIYDALRLVLPHERLFMDIDSIPPGADFVETLKRRVGECEVVLALIGPGWIDATDPKTGRRRLDNAFDFVRTEIREALKRGIPVVPVLLDETSMPDAEALPEDLRRLVRRQAEFVQFRTFDADVARLMRKLQVAPDVPPPRVSRKRVSRKKDDKFRLVTTQMRHHVESRTHDHFGFSGYRAAIACLYSRPEGATQNEVNAAAKALGSSQSGYFNMLRQAKHKWKHDVLMWDDPARDGKVYKLVFNPTHSAPRAVDPPPDWKSMNVAKTPPGVKATPYLSRDY